MNESCLAAILNPPRLWSRAEVLAKDCPIPKAAGIYAWYFRAVPPGVPTTGCHRTQGGTLLYVGISPSKPGGSGQRMDQRVRHHYKSNAEGSTLRLSLGCLLAEELGIELRRVGWANG